jgi:hypothetical protein
VRFTFIQRMYARSFAGALIGALVTVDAARWRHGHHFWIASGRTVASMRFIGPFTITYLRAEEAPRPRVYPFGY